LHAFSVGRKIRPTDFFTSFRVNKIVDGEMSNPNYDFAFTVDFTLPDNMSLPTTGEDMIVATIMGFPRVNDRINTTLPKVPIGSGVNITSLPHNFTLRHGDVITFTNVPMGTGFYVTEENATGYRQTGSVVAGGLPGMSNTVYENNNTDDLVVSGIITSLNASGNAVDGVFNFVTVTNAIPDDPPMGVFLSNLPFGLMVALGAGALVATGVVAVIHSNKKTKK